MMTSTTTETLSPLARMQARREQAIRELASDLADLVEAGDITETEANVWLAEKADQWFGGDR